MRESRPKRGSRAFYPRKRAKRIYPRQNFPLIEAEPKALGFAGYKAGMTHVMIIDQNSNSPTYGMKVFTPVTVIECPPLTVFGFRCYTKTYEGLKTLCDVFAQKLDKKLQRKTTLGKGKIPETKPEDIDLEKVYDVRLLCHTNPPFKKTPEIFEIGIAGTDITAKVEYASKLLGNNLEIMDVFSEGEFIDISAVTKGKGTQGPVKRFGVKIQGRKVQQAHRHTGVLGSRGRGRVLPTVPLAGQCGYQTRTELNKLIVKIVSPEEINPKGGFPHYGLLKHTGVLVKGSVPGPQKRLIRMRIAIRPPAKKPQFQVDYISLASKQGV